ncbi:cytokine receptor-like [Maniola hyperantus]|uniref:cytokine receptor-like n=1 Tax=Aphantopus hyperantus TaxID=2795564 RepID=UPI0015695D79|nr:cytokine receptor-like [Maniola hyperantus]
MVADLTTKTKCTATWKISEFKLWIWCTLCFMSMLCISAKCMNLDLSVSIYPARGINIEYGNPLEIFCVTEGNYSSNDIQFISKQKHIDSEAINSTTRRLYVEKPEKQSSLYYCQNSKTNKLCSSRVLVDSPPSDVTDFNCVSENLETLNCSFSIPSTYSHINYNLAFYIFKHIVLPFCGVNQIESTGYCVWNTSSAPRYRQQEEQQFFTLNACNEFGCNSQNFTIDHFSIVKPNPPYDLKVIKYDTHSVLLKWKIPNNMVDFLSCGVDHIIQYQIPKVDNRTYFRTVDTSHLPTKNKTYTFNLTDLPYAQMQYEVRIYIKSKKATKRQFWSEYACLSFTTSSEIPKRPPNIIPGAFDESILNKNERVINVYWQEIEELEEAGPNFIYKALITQGNTARIIFSNDRMNHVSFKASHDALDITVWSTNINGSSLKNSQVYIPPEKDTRNLKISSFTKVAYENGTYMLSWDGLGSKNIDNYTVLWCEHNGNQICNGRIDFAVLDSKATTHIIDLPIRNRYQFAISANSGIKSGGMTWAKIYGAYTNNKCDCTDCIQEYLDRLSNKN